VALIVNFFLSYPRRIELQTTVLTVFKRLYSSFSVFRKNLEDPIIMVLINIWHKYNELEIKRAVGSRTEELKREDLIIDKAYAEASRFINYLIQSDDTEYGFREKLFGRKELQQFLTQKNQETYIP
jgi:hypothetical protein